MTHDNEVYLKLSKALSKKQQWQHMPSQTRRYGSEMGDNEIVTASKLSQWQKPQLGAMGVHLESGSERGLNFLGELANIGPITVDQSEIESCNKTKKSEMIKPKKQLKVNYRRATNSDGNHHQSTSTCAHSNCQEDLLNKV